MLYAGFYEKEITPPLGVNMPGYFGIRRSEGVRDRLYAKSVAFGMEGADDVIIIVVDAVSTTDEMFEKVADRVVELTGVKKNNVMLSATHTHMGPDIPGRKGEFHTDDNEYFDVMLRLIADTGVLAWQRKAPVTVKHNSSVEKGLGFNRNYWMKDGSIRTNPGYLNPNIDRPFGPVDDQFTTLFFFNEENKPVGVISNFACHHDSIGGAWGKLFSSDFSGIVAKNLKKEFGNEFVSVYVSGCCGNVNHIDVTTDGKREYPRYIDIGNALTKAALEQFKTAEPLKVDTLKCEKNLIDIKRREIPKEEVEEAQYLYDTMPIEGLSYNINKPESKEYKRARATSIINISKLPDPLPTSVQAVRLGDAMIFGLPGEVYSEYGIAIKEGSPVKVNLISTLSNGTAVCYIPVPEAHGTTIYEAQKTSAYLVPEAGQMLVDEALRQAKELIK